MSNAADTLRAALKTAGYSARTVGVRQTRGGSLDVVIRSSAVSITAVSAIANAFRVVRYCEATGEILAGGNTFVNVAYDRAATAAITATVLALIARAADGFRCDVLGGAVVRHDMGACEAYLFTTADGDRIHAVGLEYAARRIAENYCDRSAQAAAKVAA